MAAGSFSYLFPGFLISALHRSPDRKYFSHYSAKFYLIDNFRKGLSPSCSIQFVDILLTCVVDSGSIQVHPGVR